MSRTALITAAGRVLATVAVVAVLAGCGASSVHYSLNTAPGAVNHVTVGHGQKLLVKIGETNASVGDAWYVAAEPDTAVLRDTGQQFDSHCMANEAGCGGTLTWTFTAVAAGNTAVVFQYCYRSTLSKCAPRPAGGPTGPITLTVTVS